LLFRLTPPAARLMVQADSLALDVGGAEANRRWLARQPAAVHGKRLAGEVVRRGRCEELRSNCD
jgi:hypothetical protein